MRYLPKPYGGAVGPVRLVTLIGLLVVVGMLMYRARDASTWRWLGRDDSADGANDDVFAENGENKVSDPLAPPPKATGPTDLDAEEIDAAEEEFQAINDGALDLGREEMPAYWRLLSWVHHQPLPLLQSRTKDLAPPRFHDLLLHADQNRGKLLRLKLNVRRIHEYPAPENPEKFAKIYEIWGDAEHSQSWLYCVVTPELPEGLRRRLAQEESVDGVRMADNLAEVAGVYGYFVRVQGYKDGGANEKTRKAPLIAGKISWKSSALAEPKPDLPPQIWIGIAAAVAVLCAGSVVSFIVFSKGKSPRRGGPPISAADPKEVSSWLSEATREAAGPDVVYLKPDGPNRDPGDTIVGN